MPATALQFVSIAVGRCPCHKSPQNVVGPVVTGSSDHSIESSGVARLNDIVVFGCGHTGIIVSTTKVTNMTNGIQKAEISSLVVGCPTAVIITGSSTAF